MPDAEKKDKYKITITIGELYDVYFWGMSEGQLLMEEERDSEDWADAFQGHIIDQKYGMPSMIAPRRQPKNEKWREAMREGKRNFNALIKQKLEETPW